LADILNKIKKPNDKKEVYVYWPREKCRYLKFDVVLEDSAGVDTLPNLDGCIGFDVIVLVVDAESELADTVSKLYILKIIFNI